MKGRYCASGHLITVAPAPDPKSRDTVFVVLPMNCVDVSAKLLRLLVSLSEKEKRDLKVGPM